MPPFYTGNFGGRFIPQDASPFRVAELMREAQFGPGVRGEYEAQVACGNTPELVDPKRWNRDIPGPERAAIMRRYRPNRKDPEDPCPHWVRCNCSEHGGGIQMRWGQAPYCEGCGALL